MKKIATLSLLLTAPFMLSSCSLLTKFLNEFHKKTSANDSFKVSVEDNDGFKVTVKSKKGLTPTDDHHLSTSNRLANSSYNPESYYFTYRTGPDMEQVGIVHLDGDLSYDSSDSIYYAFIFEITFEKVNELDTRNNIMLEPSLSNWEASSKHDTTIAKGARMAFIAHDPHYANDVIWAQLENSNECRYMNGLGEDNYYPENIRLVAEDTMTSGYEWDDPSNLNNCLGHFGEDKNKITSTVAVWFEGTDPHVVNENYVNDLELKISMEFSLR